MVIQHSNDEDKRFSRPPTGDHRLRPKNNRLRQLRRRLDEVWPGGDGDKLPHDRLGERERLAAEILHNMQLNLD